MDKGENGLKDKNEGWKLRLLIEYAQLDSRIRKLEAWLDGMDPGLDRLLMSSQLDAMKSYRGILLARAHLHDIDLEVRNGTGND